MIVHQRKRDDLPTFMEIPVQHLLVDDRYQRAIIESSVRRMIKMWDENAVGVLLVSCRGDGKFYLIDGQHRMMAARRVNPEMSLPCMVHYGMTLEQEANMFQMQTVRKSVHPIERFKAQLVAQNPNALVVQALADKHGLKIGKGPGKLVVSSIGALDRNFRAGTGTATVNTERVDRLFSMASRVFADRPEGVSHAFVDGVLTLLNRVPDALDDNRVVQVLSPIPTADLERRTKEAYVMTGSRHSASAVAILRLYNTRLSTAKRIPLSLFLREDS